METNGVELVDLSVDDGGFEDIDDDFQSVRPGNNLSDSHSHNRMGTYIGNYQRFWH